MNLKLIGIGASSFFLSQQIIMIAIIHLKSQDFFKLDFFATPPKNTHGTPKTSFVFVLCIHVLFNAPGHFAGLCNILAAPPKEKTMFSRYVYSIRTHMYMHTQYTQSLPQHVPSGEVVSSICHLLHPLSSDALSNTVSTSVF